MDEGTLPSGLGIDLETNVDHLLANRLKRHSVTYVPGPTSTSGGTPPVGDSTLVGPTLPVAGVSASDPEAIGLKLSSPPTVPITRRLGTWPLSGRATSIRVVVGCATEIANVDLFAVAVINGSATPANPMAHLLADGDGLVTFGPGVTGSTAYAAVGTTAPSVTQDVKPVELVIPLGSTANRDYGFHGSGDSVRVCSVYLCILSAVGALDASQAQSSVSTFAEDGRRLVTPEPLTSWPINPGPLHRWLKFPGNADTEVAIDADSWMPKWRGVVQLRPDSLSAPATADAVFVVHPPIAEDSPLRTDPDFAIYTCGTITIHSVTVQEVGT